MEEIMVGFVMSVIGKWSKVVAFVLEPAFYYLLKPSTKELTAWLLLKLYVIR